MSRPAGTRAPSSPGSLEALRERNRERVVGALRTNGSLSRAAVARITGLSRSTVSTVVADLVREGLVREGAEAVSPRSGGGRPATPLSMDPAAGVALSIDLAPTGLRLALANLGHEVVGVVSETFDPDAEGLANTLDRIDRLAASMLADAGVERDRIVGAAISIPAPVSLHGHRATEESVIEMIVDAPLEGVLAERLGVTVRVENDANVSALGEVVWGAAIGHTDIVYLELSKGIGAGIVIDGQLYRGTMGSAGEVGHVRVVPDGPLCRCGNRGCLEMVAGSDAIAARVADRFDHWPAVDAIVARAESGDPACRRALRDAGARIGSVVATLCNVLNPAIVVVGGELAPAWPVMESAFRESLDRSAIHRVAADLVVAQSALGAQARVLGGLALVLRDSSAFPAVALPTPT